MATISQVQEVVFRLKLEDQASDAMKAAVAAIQQLNKEFDLNDQVVQKAGKGANTLINQNDQIAKTAKTLTNVLRDLSDAQKALAADAATGGEKQAALLRTVENLTTKVQASTQAHIDAIKGVKGAGDAHDDAAKKVGLFGLSIQNTGFLIHDATKAVESLTLGMSPLQVAMQHIGQVQGIFGSLSEAAKGFASSFLSVPGVLIAATAALVGFGVAAESESRRMADLRQQLRATHDDYASLATTVDAAAKQAAASTSLSTAQAREAAQTIASAKYFSGTTQDIVDLTKVSQDLARVWKVDVSESSKFLRSAIDDPAKAAREMADKDFPGMSHALAESLGRMQAAAQGGQALATVLGVLRQGTSSAIDDQSKLGKALKQLGETFYTARDGGKSLAVQIGDMVDSFVALQVRGLDNLIKSLDAFIAKMKEVKQAYPASGLNLETGAANPGVTIPTTITTTGGSAISRVDESIRSLVAAAAKQNQLDAELLARLQLTENERPIGTDLLGNSKWAVSPTGPIGPMQVAPTTFAGMLNLPYGRQFQGQALGDNATNVNAGAAYFSYLLGKYGDVRIAVLAYHDGETVMNEVLAGGGNVSNSDKALAQALKVTRGYTGTGRALVSAGPAFAGESLTAPNAIANAGLALSGGIRGQDRAAADNAFNIATGIGPLSAQIEKAKADIAGMQAGLDLATQAGDTDKITFLTGAIAKAKGEMTNLITEQQKMARAAADAAVPLNAEAGATRDLAVIQQQFVQAARAAGTDVDQNALRTAQVNKLHELAVAFDDAVKATDRQTAANQRIAASVDQSAPSLIAATNREKALAQAREDFVPGPEREAAVDRYTAALNRQSASVADLATVQKSFDQRDQLQVLQLETDTLGKNTEQRDKEIALLKERQALIKSGADLQSAASKADLANVAAIHDATVALNQQKASLSELSSFFTSTFDTIGNAIVSAFATGQQSAVKFKDVAASVEKAVEAEFLKLALLNPLKNFLFGENSPTLFSVGGVIGNLFGGGSAAGAGASAFDTALPAVAAVASTVQAGSAATSLFGQPGTTLGSASGAAAATGGIGVVQGAGVLTSLDNLFGTNVSNWLTGSGEGIIATLGDKIVTGITDVLGNTTAATELAAQVAGQAAAQAVGGTAAEMASATLPGAVGSVEGVGTLARLAAGVSNAVGATTETTQAVTLAAGQVADAIPYIGAAISVVTDLIQGNIRGAAFVAGGGAIGAGIGGVLGGPPGAAIGAGIGALVGGLADAFFPQHPLHPFDASSLDVQGGRLIRGKTLSQAETAQAGSVVDLFATNMNVAMDRLGLVLTNLDGTIGAVGNGIQGLATVNSPAALFNKLQFGNAPGDTSQFGVAKGALAGMSFETPQALTDELAKIAGFADATAAIGIQLKSVGKDLTNIQIASVSGGGQGNALRTALSHDLTTQTFANVDALDAEITKVNQFVSGTIPGLLHPIEQTSSAITTQADKVMQTYQDAINQSLQYGLDNTAVLRAAEEQALLIVRRSGLEQIEAGRTQLADRLRIATEGGLKITSDAALHNFDVQAQQQRNALSKLWTDTYGDAVKTNSAYLRQMTDLERTLGAERVAAARATAAQLATSQRSLDNTTASIVARQAALHGDTSAVPLVDFDQKAMAERIAYKQQLLAQFGDFYIWTEDYASRITELEKVQQGERLKIVQQFGTAINTATADQLKAAQGSVATLFTSLSDYVTKLQTGTNSPLSPIAQHGLAKSQFNAVAGAAAAGDATSAGKLTGFADTLLASSRAVYGSGVGYAADFSRVLNAIQGVVQAPVEPLTNSFLAIQLQQQTTSIVQAQQATTDAINALRREFQQQQRAAA